MSKGQVISMHNAHFETPNSGQLRDLETGIVYKFYRPAVTVGTVPRKWNVKKGDIVTFTISGALADAVTLLYPILDDTVYYKL